MTAASCDVSRGAWPAVVAVATGILAWNRRDASRQVVLVVNTYALTPELEAAVRELEIAAFCEGA